jgi:hypothetical protein
LERGRQQKRNVEFTNETLVAQRLVTAFAFAGSECNWESTLRVEDPPPERGNIYYRIAAETVQPIAQSIDRIAAVRGLLLAGVYDAAAHAFPVETQMEGFAGTPLARHGRFDAEGQEWVGQSYTLPFPFPIAMDSGLVVGACRARFGVSPAFLNALARLSARADVVDSFLRETDLRLALHTDADERAPEGADDFTESREAVPPSGYASIRNGRVLISDWELLSA